MSTKASLVYIDDQSKVMTTNGVGQTRKMNVAGFEVDVPLTENDNDFISVKSYRNDEAALRTFLQDKGIIPLAVLPLSWWDTIIDKANLIRIQTDKEGMVSCDVRDQAKHIRDMARYWWLGFVSIWFCLTALASIAFEIAKLPTFCIVAAAAVAVPISVASTFIFDKSLYSYYAWVYQKYVGRARLLKAILRDDSYYSGRVRLSLPTPPDDVKEVLIKAKEHNLDMHTVAEEKAVALAYEPYELIAMRARQDELEDARRRREARMADPIVYVRNRSAVAIIAQFGEFPIEKKIVDTVMATRI